jgi:hypothetical protein
MSIEQAGPGFERDIRPLFRAEDVKARSFAFNLASDEDVRMRRQSASGLPTEACPAIPAGRPIRSSGFAPGSTPDRLPRP